MFEILVKIVKAIKPGALEVIMSLLAVLLLSGLFGALGAGQAGGLQRGTDVLPSANGDKE